MKKAYLVGVYVQTRVVVDENATEEQILQEAKSRILQNCNNDFNELVDYVSEDYECPAEQDEML